MLMMKVNCQCYVSVQSNLFTDQQLSWQCKKTINTMTTKEWVHGITYIIFIYAINLKSKLGQVHFLAAHKLLF